MRRRLLLALALEVDEEAWLTTYGIRSADLIRDVQSYVESTLLASVAAQENLILRVIVTRSP
jgi:hypothetical protein